MKHDSLNCQHVLSEGSSESFKHWISLWISSGSSNNIVYVCKGTRLERHLENWDGAISPNMKREEWNIHPPYCLQTPGEESIKHNAGFFLSLRHPVGFESPHVTLEALLSLKKTPEFYFDVWINQQRVSSEQKDLMLPVGSAAIWEFAVHI